MKSFKTVATENASVSLRLTALQEYRPEADNKDVLKYELPQVVAGISILNYFYTEY